MNNQQTAQTGVPKPPKVMKESKNKIKVDFERTPLKERLKAKFLNGYFFKNLIWGLFRYVFLSVSPMSSCSRSSRRFPVPS